MKLTSYVLLWTLVIFNYPTLDEELQLPDPPLTRETEWSEWLRDQQFPNAEIEHRLPDGSRVDILSPEYAIEVEWSDKWPEAIGQALWYAKATDRPAGIYLLLRNNHDEDYIRCVAICRDLNIKLWTIDTD